MHSRQLLVEASVAVIAVLALTKPVGAQTPQDGGRPVRTTALAPQRDEILVTGIRMGIAAARDEKRKADQIVDIVKAEDIEKLPNNTVGDAIALIPGLQVDRSEGEVNGIQLRGLGGVQTTLNGSPITSSLDRTAAISDLPADLVKSIEVYKTRTPEQVEGSGAGTINITLKRPLDFSRGLTGTAAANVRYNNQSKRYNQNYNAILNYNMDTAIGGLGFMVNATWNSNPFLESRAINDNFATLSSRQATGQQILPSPTFAPNQVQFSYITGERRSPTVSGAVQWSPDDRTDVVLEGTYTAIRKENDNNDLFVAITGGTGSTLPQLSNVVLVPGTNRLRSVTVATANQTGPIAYLFNQRNDQYFAKLSTIHRGDSFDASAEIQYGGSFSFNHDRTTRNRFVTRPIYDVDFASDRFKFPMVNVEFRNVDLLDASQYRFVQFDEQQRVNDSETWSGRADLTLRTSQPLLPEIRVGMRWQHQTYLRRVYQRGVGGLNIPMADMPEGWNRLVPIAEGFAGTGVVNNARWLAYGSDARPNLDKLIRFLAPFSSQFQAPTPPINNGDYFDGNEKTFGFYAQASYNFDLLVPIRGVFGARVVNTMLSLNSFERISRSRVVNGINQTVTDLVPNNARSNYVNVLPSINAIVAFTDELQFRVGWSRDMRRPSPYSLTPNIAFSELAFSGDAGNPDLRPEKTEKFDASLEYYFASRGLVSIAPFYWNLDGAFANFRTLEILGSDPQFYNIQRSYNAGRGYRRGVEVQGQAFATFLPGPLKGFGAIANYTFVDSQLEFDALPGGLTAPPAKAPIAGTSRNTFNVTGLYQRAGIDARVSYNWVGKRIDEIRNPLNLSLYRLPMTWMDVAVNYTFSKGPLRGLMISAQMQNALASAARNFYGFPDQPREVVYWARTYGGGMRYRF